MPSSQYDNVSRFRAREQTEKPVEDESLSELVGDVGNLLIQLVRKEVLLGTAEIEKSADNYVKAAKKASAGVGLLAGGGLALVAFMVAVTYEFLILGLGVSAATSLWLSPLLVGGTLCLIGYGLIKRGQQSVEGESAVPERAVRNLKEDLSRVSGTIKN